LAGVPATPMVAETVPKVPWALLTAAEPASSLMFAVSTLEALLAPLGREPHSVIGSSCIGASVVGGICNNSGGALVRRGPAYTEAALYARVTEGGRVELVNHLGLTLPDEALLGALGSGEITDADLHDDGRAASASGYDARVSDVEAASPARFNADPTHLFEASGSAGKVMVLAVRLDTFPKDERTATFYVGTNDPAELDRLRRRLLTELPELPVSGEYIHREAFDVAARYGKDAFLAIRFLGTGRLPALFALKNRVDRIASRIAVLPANLADRLMQGGSRLFPQHLPRRMLLWRDRYEHHLLVKVANSAIEPARSLLGGMFSSATGDVFECSAEEAQKAFLHRFAVAGAAIRYRAIHGSAVGDIIALDIALRRNDRDWLELLPPEIDRLIVKKLYYGHYLCHVFHQDYVLAPGVDPEALEHRMWELLDARGAEYPAEHNVGQLYPAKPALVRHYRTLDPTNTLNPGIGKTSRQHCWH